MDGGVPDAHDEDIEALFGQRHFVQLPDCDLPRLQFDERQNDEPVGPTIL